MAKARKRSKSFKPPEGPSVVLTIPVGVGEAADRLIHLLIRADHIADQDDLGHTHNGLAAIRRAISIADLDVAQVEASDAYRALEDVHRRLWDTRRRVRIYMEEMAVTDEQTEQFVEDAAALARLEDQRLRLRRRLDIQFNSDMMETCP